MLDVNHLTRSYGSFVAVNQVSFSISKGEIVGLLGHNGAGKTTIMKMLSGFLEPNQGSITLNHLPLLENPKAAQMHIGYLPENSPVYPEMTVIDYLDYVAELKHIKGHQKTSEMNRVIQATELQEKAFDLISTLSRGYKQRVGVSQAILGNPKVLILDEPTNGLDPTQTEHMRQLIKSLSKDATIILSTHIMQEVNALCDRVLIINSGELALDEQLEKLRQSKALLLTCSAPLDDIQHCLMIEENHIEPLSMDDASSSRYSYRLFLTQEQNMDAFCSETAKKVIQSGHQLFQLQVEQYDLESLFKETAQKKQTFHSNRRSADVA